MNFFNLKKLTFTGLLFTGLLASGAQAAIEPNLERDLIRVCKALQSNDRMALQRAVKRSRVSYKNLSRGLQCNGMSAMSFAQNNGAKATATLWARKANLKENEMVAKR